MAKKNKLAAHIFRNFKDPAHQKHFPVFLTTLRILSRDKNGLDELFTADRIENLMHLSRLIGDQENLNFNSENFDARVVVESLKCLCNLIYLSPAVRHICCNNSCIDGIMLRLKMYKDPHLPTEVKYFDLRILFLMTALCPEIRPKIRDEYHGLIYLMEAVDLILKEAEEPGQKPSKKSQRKRKKDRTKVTGEMNSHSSDQNSSKKEKESHSLDNSSVDLCCEVLKVLFNLTVTFDRGHLDEVSFFQCIYHSFLIFSNITTNSNHH